MKLKFLVFLALAFLVLFACSKGKSNIVQPSTNFPETSYSESEKGSNNTRIIDKLQGELELKLKENGIDYQKQILIAPKGNKNKVDDLKVMVNSQGKVEISWSYKNVGDYNQDGMVNIADITSLAEHFFESANNNNIVVDGNFDGEINIADITPLAENFFSNVSGYLIQISPDNNDNNFVTLQSVSLGSFSGDPKKAKIIINRPDNVWFRVVPFDGQGIEGIVSIKVKLSGNKPVILGISPAIAIVGKSIQLTAEILGSKPFLKLGWTFPGGWTKEFPYYSIEESPIITPKVEGDVWGNLYVQNEFGYDLKFFDMKVITDKPILQISSVKKILKELNRGESANHSFVLKNLGGGVLEYQIQNSENWLRISPKSGSLDYNQSATLYCVITAPQTSSIYNDTIVISTNDENNSRIEIPVRLRVPYPAGRSDWYMFGRDLKQNRRSSFSGPVSNNLKWIYPINGRVISSPVIGVEGMVYVGGGEDFSLHAISSYGNTLWTFPTQSYVFAGPAIGKDGTIYFGSADGYLYALDSLGELKWKFNCVGIVYDGPILWEQDGQEIILVGSWISRYNGFDYEPYGIFYAINPDGTLKWRYIVPESIINSSPAISDEGIIYLASRDVLNAIDSRLISRQEFDYTDQSIKWRTPIGSISGSPAIGPDGTIYVAGGSRPGYFFAINPDGSFKWVFRKLGLDGNSIVMSPAIDSDGTVYTYGTKPSTGIMYLYALDPSLYSSANENAMIKWSFQIDSYIDSEPLIDSNGNIYFVTIFGHVYALNREGTLIWEWNEIDWTGVEYPGIYSAMALSDDGTLYFGANNGYLYAF